MIPLYLTLDQVQNLLGLIDNGVRATGLKGAMVAAPIAKMIDDELIKYHTAQNQPKAESKNDGITPTS